ncbi:hypothetical protein BUZ62_12520, partial [Staphylococcus pasteuri]|uniref:TIR domain-containing protein n=1 Tax=Staphylococcus pasteuri TaxID=45972 RepID=UPI000D482970
NYKVNLKKYFNENFNVYKRLSERVNPYKAKVFISYRKKDKIKLLKLLYLIRNLTYFNPIEIWYDDYLNPGENYNSVIYENIQNCDFVLLLVTENCLERGNYIERIEYPKALQHGKKVIPVSIEEEDISKIREVYEELDEVINLNKNPQELERRIKDISMMSTVLTENLTAEETGELALKYLEDFKINNTQGLKLLIDSAKENYGPAMNKLGKLYFEGNMIEKNIEKSIYWLDRSLIVILQQFEDSYIFENENDIFDKGMTAAKNALQLYEVLERKGNTKNKYIYIYSEVCKKLEQFGFMSDLVNFGHALFLMSNISLEEGNLLEAINQLDRASSYFKYFYENTQNPFSKFKYSELLMQKAKVYRYIGDKFGNSDNYFEASENLLEALSIIKYINKHFEICYQEMLYLLNELSIVGYNIEKKGDYVNIARKLYKEIYYEAKEFYKLSPTIDVSFRIALIGISYAVVNLETPDLAVLEESKYHIKKCLELEETPEYINLYNSIQKRIAIWPFNLG